MAKQTCDLCGESKCACEKEIRVYFCPNCKSGNVKYVFGLGNIFGIIPRMKCSDCGYQDSVFPLIVTNKKMLEVAKNNLKKKIKSKKGGKKR